MDRSIVLLTLALLAGAGDAASLSEQAAAAAADNDQERAASLWKQHLAESPDDGSAHYRLGTALMSLDRLDEAETHFRRAGELSFQPQGVGYRLARIQARRGEHELALDALESLAGQGFAMPALIENEADFDALKERPRFQAALESIRGARFPCKSSPAHRAFDFWIGTWDVSSQGAPAGHNEIIPVSGDCVLYENWTSVTGGTGKSFNFYDSAEGHWRQIWIGDRGGVIEFTGQFEDGVLHYTAETKNPNGTTTLHKLDFYPNEDRSVRQHWQQSNDGGETWQVAFDGHYVKTPTGD